MTKKIFSFIAVMLLASNVYANTQTPAKDITTNVSGYTKNLNSSSTTQQIVDNAVDQLNVISSSPHQCNAGNYPLGIDTSGNAQNCTPVQSSLTFSKSILNTSGDVTLVNDATSPGNSYYYGTNSSGTKGYFVITPGGVTNVTASLPISSSGGATPNISTSMSTNKLLGRGTSGTGVTEEITLGTGLSLSGTILNSSSTPSGGNINDVQINNGSGGFNGYDNLKFISNLLQLSGSGSGDYLGSPALFVIDATDANPWSIILRNDTAGNTKDFGLFVDDSGSFVIGNNVNNYALSINDLANIIATGNITANSFIKNGGTSVQFLKADGSVDSTTYQVDLSLVKGTYTDGKYCTYSSSGTLLNCNSDAGTGTVTSISTTSPITGGTITSTGTIGITQADTSADGYLSSTDWNTFNNKFTLPSLTSGSVLFSNGSTISQNNSAFFWDNTNDYLGINQTTPLASVHAGSSTTTCLAPTGGTATFGGVGGNGGYQFGFSNVTTYDVYGYQTISGNTFYSSTSFSIPAATDPNNPNDYDASGASFSINYSETGYTANNTGFQYTIWPIYNTQISSNGATTSQIYDDNSGNPYANDIVWSQPVIYGTQPPTGYLIERNQNNGGQIDYQVVSPSVTSFTDSNSGWTSSSVYDPLRWYANIVLTGGTTTGYVYQDINNSTYIVNTSSSISYESATSGSPTISPTVYFNDSLRTDGKTLLNAINGYTGINNTSPFWQLDVGGDINTNGSFRVNNVAVTFPWKVDTRNNVYTTISSPSSGFSNFFSGYQVAGANSSSGSYNTAIGSQAGYSLTSAQSNFIAGFSAGYSITTGSQNNIIGNSAGYSLTTGNSNTLIGDSVGYKLTTGSNNFFAGAQVASINTATGDNNVSIGNYAGASLSSGVSNTFIGGSGYATTTGSYNTFLGPNGGTNTTGSFNTFINNGAGLNNTTGSYNLFFGYNTGGNNTTGNNNIIISANQGYMPSNNATNTLNLGNLIWGTGLDGSGATVSSGNIGIGLLAPSARLHIISTSEQLRSGYDASDYWNATTGSSGTTTFAATGSVPKFIFSPTSQFNGTVNLNALTASQILATDSSKNIQTLTTATYPSLTELSYVKGVTSAIQTQINAKGAGTVTTASVVTANGFSGTVANATTTPAITLGQINWQAVTALMPTGNVNWSNSSGYTSGYIWTATSGNSANWQAPVSSGVTSIATSNGITGGTITSTGTISGVNALADGSTKGVSTYTANDFDSSSGNISLDYTNGQKATNSVSGFLSSTDHTAYSSLISSQWTLSSTNLYSPIINTVTVGTSSTSQNIFTVNSNGVLGKGLSVNYTTASVNATGGTITFSGGNKIHTFNTSGTFTPTVSGNVTVQVVGAGASGGGGTSGGLGGGGGGAGQFVPPQTYAITAGVPITVTIGAKGSSVAALTQGIDGGSTIFGSITAIGGGKGGKGNSVTALDNGTNGGNGASGGGGGGARAGFGPSTAGTGTAGNNGGVGSANDTGNAGGGGGSSGVGTAAAQNAAGGIGTSSSISGSSLTYCTGGMGEPTSGPVNGVNPGDGGSGGYVQSSSISGSGVDGQVVVSYPTPNNKPEYVFMAAGVITAKMWTDGANSDQLTFTVGSTDRATINTSGVLSVPASISTPALSNLTSNGPVYTSGGVGTLNIGTTTGSGTVYALANSPTFITPALGTPSSGTLTNATGLPEGGLSLTDITTNNSSTSKHGFLLKLNNTSTTYMDGTGNWSTPSVSSVSRLFSHFADVGNSGTSETDLYTDTISAGKLASNGDTIIAQYGGSVIGAATAAQEIKIYFGGTAIVDSGPLTINSGTKYFRADVSCVRESSTIVRCGVNLLTNSNLLTSTTLYTKITGLTLSNTQIIKITGQVSGAGSASNQILASEGYVNYQPI